MGGLVDLATLGGLCLCAGGVLVRSLWRMSHEPLRGNHPADLGRFPGRTLTH